MRAIYKYPVFPVASQFINLPIGSEMLCVQSQGGAAFLWAIVEPEKEVEERQITMLATGQPFEGPVGKHLGTVQFFDGNLIFHFFED